MASSSQQHKANYQKLLKMGVDKNWLDQQFNQPGVSGTGNLAKGNYIDDKDVAGILNAWPAAKAQLDAQAKKLAELEARTPDFMKNDPTWATLPADMKEMAVYNYEIQKANDQQKAIALAKALEQATAQAEPYWKNIILIAQDEILRGFEQAQGDYDSSVQRQSRIIESIQKDLTTNKNFLSLEQQSDLASISRNYKANQESIINSAAESGLTFSTKRKLAEQKLAEQNTQMVESTNRQYNKQITDLTAQAQRGSVEAQKEIEDLQRRIKESTTALGRTAETKLGTENLPNLPGYTPLGNVPGDIYEQKVQDIEQRKQGIYNELISTGLPNSLGAYTG